MLQHKKTPAFYTKKTFHLTFWMRGTQRWYRSLCLNARLCGILACFTLASTSLCFAAKHPKAVTEALALAGENKKELLTVLDHYTSSPKDSLKYRAACFLIANMPIHDSRTYYWEDSLGKRVSYNEFDYPDFKTAVESFNKIALRGGLHPVVVTKSDISTMSAQYLTRNIEQAFEALSKPWSRYLPFETFCEQLLSYRFLDEQYAEWREPFYKTYAAMAAPHQGKDVRAFCAAMCDSLKGVFFNTYVADALNTEPAFLSPTQMLFRRQGACEDMASWGGYVFRSMGIATAVDYTPAWATSTGSHYWNVAFGEHGQAIPFVMGSTDTPNRYYIHREPSKVLRITYSSQPATLAQRVDTTRIPEGFLRHSNYLDVTRDYWMVADLRVTLDSAAAAGSIAYVAVLNGLAWRPVWWGETSGTNAVFKDLSCGVVYLPMSYRAGRLTPAAEPYLLRRNDTVQILKADTRKLQSIALPQQEGYLIFRPGKKYTLYCWYRGAWRSLGMKTATDASPLRFDRVPSGALYLLVPEYSAGKERPFTINAAGNREWW